MLASNNLSDLSNAGTARTNLGVAIGSDVQAHDADTLKADTADELTAGFSSATEDAGTKSSGTFTPSPDTGGFTKVDGDDLTTTNGHEFFLYITRYNDGSTTFSALTVKALQ